MNGRFRPAVLVGSGTRRILAIVFVLACVAFVLLPRHAQFFIHDVGQPLADVVAIPIESMASLTRGLRDGWNQVFSFHTISEQNHDLRQRVQQLRGELNQWQERALGGGPTRRVSGISATHPDSDGCGTSHRPQYVELVSRRRAQQGGT